MGYITPLGRIVTNFNSLERSTVQVAAGGNCSFRRKLIEEVGIYDINFIGNALLEDADFPYRAYKLGYQIVYDPDAEIYHLALKTGGNKTRTQNEEEYYYWFLRNKSYFFLKTFLISISH